MARGGALCGVCILLLLGVVLHVYGDHDVHNVCVMRNVVSADELAGQPDTEL
jgi:hypothetical protein